MDILRRYQSDFGKTYVQVKIDGQNVELAFDHDPTDAEIEKVVTNFIAYNAPPVPTINLMAEDGTKV